MLMAGNKQRFSLRLLIDLWIMLLPTPTAVAWVRCSVAFVFVCMYLFLLSVFPHDISKTDAARSTKPDTDKVHHDSWKLIYLGSKVKVARHKNIGNMGHDTYECWLFLVVTVISLSGTACVYSVDICDVKVGLKNGREADWCVNIAYLSYFWYRISLLWAVIYSLTETETETNIISLSETERETEMICKTEMKYKRKSEHMKHNSNWNENDFKTKMVTWNVKYQAFLVLRFSDSEWVDTVRRNDQSLGPILRPDWHLAIQFVIIVTCLAIPDGPGMPPSTNVNFHFIHTSESDNAGWYEVSFLNTSLPTVQQLII